MMHLQHGVPQLYNDQMNAFGEHLCKLRYDPEWNEALEEALLCLEVMKKDTYNELSKAELHKTLKTASLRKQRKLIQLALLLRQKSDGLKICCLELGA